MKTIGVAAMDRTGLVWPGFAYVAALVGVYALSMILPSPWSWVALAVWLAALAWDWTALTRQFVGRVRARRVGGTLQGPTEGRA